MESMVNLKRKDTTKGPSLRILSLDGGGVRGYSMFLIIQEIMYQTFVELYGRPPRRSEIPKPCQHFDLIVGTGTGGLIALMLGRLRLDLETCKELYVQLTRMVFETDKTIAGIPYRSTLFKATRLEEAIKLCVREHTGPDKEGGDDSGASLNISRLPCSVVRSRAASPGPPRRLMSNASTVSFSVRSPTAQIARPAFSNYGGNPDALLYDERECRTKTMVTCVYKGTPMGGDPAVLRSYDSRKESAADFTCRIWEAGRATCAIGLAFKPIKIGQIWYHDEGAGTFNPCKTALEEAAVNEWPGRPIGVILSVGTGKRPASSEANSSQWYEGFLGDYAEARRKLVAKIEGCEKIHEAMRKEWLPKYSVDIDAYYRFNVEVGVGEFGMNEWNRLAEISTNTRRYMGRREEQHMVQSVSTRLARIHVAKQRWERRDHQTTNQAIAMASPIVSTSSPPPLTAELPGDMPSFSVQSPRPTTRDSYDIDRHDELDMAMAAGPTTPRMSEDRPRLPPKNSPRPGHTSPVISFPPSPRLLGHRAQASAASSSRVSSEDDRLTVNAPTPSEYRTASGSDKMAIVAPDHRPLAPLVASSQAVRPMPRPSSPPAHDNYIHTNEPPPLPPKTPLGWVGRAAAAPPYPMDDVDDPPPVVNLARKPDYKAR